MEYSLVIQPGALSRKPGLQPGGASGAGCSRVKPVHATCTPSGVAASFPALTPSVWNWGVEIMTPTT